MLHRISAIGVALALVIVAPAQEQHRDTIAGNNPEQHKLIADKIIEIGLPLLFLFLIAHSIVSIIRTRAEQRLRERAIDRGLSEPTLMSLFGEDRRLSQMVYLKWFLVLAALGLSLAVLHLMAVYSTAMTGFLQLAIVSFFQAAALLVYYRVSRRQ